MEIAGGKSAGRFMKKTIQIVAWAVLVTLVAMTARPCLAADSAVLRNGFSIRHERRQVIGTMTRLYVNGDGSSFVDVPTAEIDHFEAVPAEPASNLNMQTSIDILGNPARPNPANASPTVLNHTALNHEDLNQVVTAASGTYRLDPDLVNSVIRAESGFNVRAVSPKGAQGLMQLMPQTASALGVRNAFDPQANIEGGTRYLRELLERYDFDLIKALAAYNAGPERVEQYGGVPPYYETKAYVARIVRDFNKKKLAARTSSQTPVKVTPHKNAANKSTATSPKSHPSNSQAQAKSTPAAPGNLN
jgi:hypothetical protein